MENVIEILNGIDECVDEYKKVKVSKIEIVIEASQAESRDVD